MKKYQLFNLVLAAALTVFADSSMAKSATMLDQIHATKGLECATCHGTSEPREAVTMVKCIQCHNTKKLAKKTKNLKPTNPHDNRHFGTETDCLRCHHVHKKSENYCATCHPRFDFKVP